MTIQLYYGPYDPNSDPSFPWITKHGPVYQNPAISVTPVVVLGINMIDIRLSVKNHGAPSANPVTVLLYAVQFYSDPSSPSDIANELRNIVEGGTALTPSPWQNQTVPAYSTPIGTEWNIPGMGKKRWAPPSARYAIVSKLQYTGGDPITPQYATESDDYSTDPHVGVWIQF